MIIQVRSCSGGGKTYAVRGLLAAATSTPLSLSDADKKVLGMSFYIGDRNVAIVGKYDAVCGGCDTIKTADAICDRIRLFAAWADVVVFEGRIPSHTYQRYADLFMEQTPDHRAVIAYLDTTPEQCIANIASRRVDRGKDPLDWDVARVRDKDFPMIENTRQKFLRDGFDVRSLPYATSALALLDIVTEPRLRRAA